MQRVIAPVRQSRGDVPVTFLSKIEQTMFGEAQYRSCEVTPVRQPCFLIRNHTFSDGNKRFCWLPCLKQE